MMLAQPITIICGHFGVGKSNVAVNLALHMAQSGVSDLTFADLDIVNPYFRSADSENLLTEHGIRCLLPDFANTNVDIPSLPANIYSLFERHQTGGKVIMDIGGDNGAIVLGMFSERIRSIGYDMIYVVSCYRPLTREAEESVAIMREIEGMSRLRCTAIWNNSSIGPETTEKDVIDSISYAENVAALTSLPLLGTSYYDELLPQFSENIKKTVFASHPLFPMRDVTRHLYNR